MNAVYFDSSASPVSIPQITINFFSLVFKSARYAIIDKPPKIQKKLSGFMICDMPTKIGLNAISIVVISAVQCDLNALSVSQKNKSNDRVAKIRIGRRNAKFTT